jgi:predicted ATPase
MNFYRVGLKKGKEKEFSGGWEGLIDKISDDYALRHTATLRFYSFVVPKIRSEISAKKQLILDSDGGNLAQVLLSLRKERPKTFTKIEDILKLAIPEVEELLTPLTKPLARKPLT